MVYQELLGVTPSPIYRARSIHWVPLGVAQKPEPKYIEETYDELHTKPHQNQSKEIGKNKKGLQSSKEKDIFYIEGGNEQQRTSH